MGWQGKVLRVDLSALRCEAEPLRMDWAQDFIGQRGLATKYLMAEMDPSVDALSPENKLIFATGPLTGTMAATGGRWSAVTKGALTGAIACSNSGGQFGGELKQAGWDLVIVQGRAPHPVYLHIEDGQARLLDARGLWGKTVWETEPALKALHRDPLMRVASIGPAGETGCRYACIVNDMHRAAGRSGVGAVMGAKNLKAVAVRGTVGVRPAKPDEFAAVTRATHQRMAKHAGRQSLTRFGTIPMMDATAAYGALPTRNNREVQFEGASKMNAATMQRPNANGHTNFIRNGACFGCTIGCGRICHIDPTHFSVKDRPQYHGASGGLEYETAYALGAACGVDDMDAATFAGFICNEYGMDPISLGGTIAAAMELFELGVIGLQDTGGIELRFGSAEAMCRITELTARGEGFGRDIAMGSKRLCEKYGRPELSMAVKGQEFAAYDGRGMQGMGLAYATSNRGACHLRASPYDHDFRTTDIAGKAKVVKDSQDLIAAIDSTGLCSFTSHTGFKPQTYADHLEAALGGGWTLPRMLAAGERIWNLERQFNLAAGLTAADDSLPRRLLEEPAPSGAAKGLVAQLGEMLPEYYALRGWTAEGQPTPATLARVGLA